MFFIRKVLNYVNIVFTSVFTIECILKIIAFNPKVCSQEKTIWQKYYQIVYTQYLNFLSGLFCGTVDSSLKQTNL